MYHSLRLIGIGCIIVLSFFIGMLIGRFIAMSDTDNFQDLWMNYRNVHIRVRKENLDVNKKVSKITIFDANKNGKHSDALRDLQAVDTTKPTQAPSCGEDCRDFQQSLNVWPAKKPKAAIYYLTRSSRLKVLKLSLTTVERFFNSIHRYPIIIFHEGDLDSDVIRRELQSCVRTTLYFQSVSFNLPPFVNKSAVPNKLTCRSTPNIGYRHMCRFHAQGIYQQPILKGLEYVWRLDDDSFLLSDVVNNVFETMKNGNFLYGYILVQKDELNCTTGLWPATKKYVEMKQIKTEFFSSWPDPNIYYNNFEISALSLWMSPGYQDYIQYIDQLGGIYYHRWGDAPIKSLAVSMFVPRNRTHNFSDVKYQHRQYKKSSLIEESCTYKPSDN